MITPEGIRKAAERISQYVLRTPVFQTEGLNSDLDCEVFLKLEHLQPTGSFKIRGATNRILTLPRRSLDEGVVAASTGNHGAAVARAARLLETSAVIYVPEGASKVKLAAATEDGAEIRYFGKDGIEAEKEARRFARENSVAYVSPYNDEAIVMGQGTIGIELDDQIPGLDVVYVSVGGGGLISGVASYLKSIRPETTIVACSASNSAVMHHSVAAGQILDLDSEPTLSDGTAGGIEPDSITFDLCRELVDRWILVEESTIERTLKFCIESLRLTVEGSAAVALAGLVSDSPNVRGKQCAVVMCGGNISKEQIEAIVGRD